MLITWNYEIFNCLRIPGLCYSVGNSSNSLVTLVIFCKKNHRFLQWKKSHEKVQWI